MISPNVLFVRSAPFERWIADSAYALHFEEYRLTLRVFVHTQTIVHTRNEHSTVDTTISLFLTLRSFAESMSLGETIQFSIDTYATHRVDATDAPTNKRTRALCRITSAAVRTVMCVRDRVPFVRLGRHANVTEASTRKRKKTRRHCSETLRASHTSFRR